MIFGIWKETIIKTEPSTPIGAIYQRYKLVFWVGNVVQFRNASACAHRVINPKRPTRQRLPQDHYCLEKLLQSRPVRTILANVFLLVPSSSGEPCDIISYPLFADADKHFFFAHLASQNHARPKCRREQGGILYIMVCVLGLASHQWCKISWESHRN